VPELGPLGSVRGALSNERPYRDRQPDEALPSGVNAGHATPTGAIEAGRGRGKRTSWGQPGLGHGYGIRVDLHQKLIKPGLYGLAPSGLCPFWAFPP